MGDVPIGVAIAQARGPMSQRELAERVGQLVRRPTLAQATVSRWEKGIEAPTLDEIAAIEAVLGRPRGHLLRAAGYVGEVLTTEDAIRDDPALDDRGRQTVLDFYSAERRRSDPAASVSQIEAKRRRKSDNR